MSTQRWIEYYMLKAAVAARIMPADASAALSKEAA